MDGYIEIRKRKKSKYSQGLNLQQKPDLNTYEISEKDFFPPEDKRKLKSGVKDISGGDTFSDYFDWFYDNYEDDLLDN